MPQKDNKKKKNKVPTLPPRIPRGQWILFLVFAFFIGMYFFNSRSSIPEITWQEFEQKMLSRHDVKKLDVINREKVEVYIKQDSLSNKRYDQVPTTLIGDEKVKGPHFYFNIGSVEVFEQNLKEAEQQLGVKEIPVTYNKRENWFGKILAWVIPLGILFLIWMFIIRRMAARGGGMGQSLFNFGKSKAAMFDKDQKSQVNFDNVAGLEEAKEEILEIVKFLKHPERFTKLGAKIPKGVMLVGPPGTGKTLLAKAVAGEAGVPFFSLSGSEFIEMFVGVGASRVRDLFEKAKAKAPSIIFIDEIDTIGRRRGKAKSFQQNDERESTLNQLLSELDGFDPNTEVIVLAATNRADVIDPALLRPGRFDRHIHLEMPNQNERKAIFKVHLKPLKRLNDNVDVNMLASQTPGFSGADIANVCNEAALIAARHNKEEVDKQDFMDAIDRVVGGLEKRSKIISDEEKKIIAYHEAGHVTTSWFLEHTHPVLKVSIIPRGKSLGASWYLPKEHQIVTKSTFLDNMCGMLGGRAAEEITFDEISSNALDDLEKVTKQAYSMVAYYGLSEELGNISFYDSTGQDETTFQKPYSEETGKLIDKIVRELVESAYERAKAILKEHEKELGELASLLIKKEVVYQKDIENVLGPRPDKAEDTKKLEGVEG